MNHSVLHSLHDNMRGVTGCDESLQRGNSTEKNILSNVLHVMLWCLQQQGEELS